MVERLMRHSIDVAGRYFDPTIEEMSVAISRFPKLLDGQDLDTAITAVDQIPLKDPLQSSRSVSSISSAASSSEHLRTSDLPPSPDPSPEDAAHHGPSVAAGQGGFASVPAGTGQRVESTSSRPVMPSIALERLDSNALADLFESLGRLLRSGHVRPDHEQRQRSA